MTRFILLFILAFSTALCVTYYIEGLSVLIFQELLSAFIVIAMITGTLSYALYAYVDSVIKDVAANENNSEGTNYNKVIEKLTELKKEILVNAFSVVGLLVVERIAHGFALIFPVTSGNPFNWAWAFAISIRVACLFLSIVIAAIQFHGFIIANEYRAIISRRI
ncbi:hypothetical protein LZ24_02506 [Desulfobotulus alkaliphilus]|uniref:Uncharacterized protein n=1 Tax=Desulfobotulus alkaliphilus TaxID=622671 RepID=A0A562RJ19_9BACT|nr:hypothetical protein [Desulfobotulus alkaliphilus]TWI68534.1 hypothetical protein LZ24_02506 [Desulfobotulus alkaliphilus]